MITKGLIKIGENETLDEVYQPKTLSTYFKKLDTYYQNNLGNDNIDERFFIDETKIHTPEKLMLFAKQNSSNKLNVPNQPTSELSLALRKGCTSYRTLSYEMSEKVSLKSNLNEIVFWVLIRYLTFLNRNLQQKISLHLLMQGFLLQLQ